jgi:hypothetical protein
MLSLVSTLAEDMNGVKMGLNHLTITSLGGSIFQNEEQYKNKPLEESGLTLNLTKNENLIDVSDDSDSDSDSDNETKSTTSDNDNESNVSYDDLNEDSDNEDTSSESNNITNLENDIKVFKLNISNQINDDEIDDHEINDDEIDDIDENNKFDNLEELEELDDNLSLSHSESSELNDTNLHEHDNSLENKDDSLINNTISNENLNIPTSDLKTISINLEDSFSESLDFKKLPLQKLRNIVSEKGLSSDSSKLKKNELLKLLGAE